MKKIVLQLVFLICVISQINQVKAQMVETKITFNSYTAGNLNGQDGWKTISTGGTGDMQVAYSGGANLITPDTTLGCFFNIAGAGVGKNGYRKSTPQLKFDFSIGGVAEIDVDLLTNYWGSSFGFYYDKDSNGLINGTLLEGGLSVYSSTYYYGLNNEHKPVHISLPNGTTIKCTYDSATTGWSNFRLVIDFEANSGTGSLTLFAKKPSWPAYQVLPEANNIPLNLTPGSGDKNDPAMWKTFLMHMETDGGGVDNIKIRQPNTGGLQYQYLTFDNMANFRLSTDAPFKVHAVSNKLLPVTYTVSGPATISNDTVTLTGAAGTVIVTAHQPGNATIAAAADLPISIEIIDPLSLIPTLDIKNPIDTVIDPTLDKIPLSFNIVYPHHELISITQTKFTINQTDIITPDSTDNGYYIAYWKPSLLGPQTLHLTVQTSGGVTITIDTTFIISSNILALNYKLLDAVPAGSLDTNVILPSFVGSYSKVMAYLDYICPCDPWDRIGSVNITGANGWSTELLRYITPYGVACHDSIDITDYVSQMQGKVYLKSSFTSPSTVTITLKYIQGTPTHKYSWVSRLWVGDYPFGLWSASGAQQPVPHKTVNLNQMFNTQIKAASIRMIATGHGWGDANTSNAAEFYNATHNIKVNGTTAFTQHLWQTCNPNPAGCSPQSGTWQYNREGWCPGSIGMLWRWDLASFVGQTTDLMYEFDPNYINHCSGGDPNCVSGVTCTTCNASSMPPDIIVHSNLVTFYDEAPFGIDNNIINLGLELYPNPSNGLFNLALDTKVNSDTKVEIYNISGVLLKKMNWNGEAMVLNLTDYSKGIYLLKVSNIKGIEYRKIIVKQ